MFEQIHDGTAFLRLALQGFSKRQQALSTNVANADTPGYKRVEVGFETQLQAKLRPVGASPLSVSDDRHIGLLPDDRAFAPTVDVDQATSLRRDGNNVDIDAEMARLAQNEIGYNAAVQFLGGRFTMLKYVIADGGAGG